ncbi:MAG: hypothetical protein ACKOBW_00900, partial [Planctomycetota bacterium]
MDTQHRRHLRLRSCLRAVAGKPLWTGLAIVGLGLPGLACGQTTERVTSANRGMVRRVSASISSDAPGRVVPAKATQPGSWTLSQFEQLALGNHPSLSEYQGKVEAARGRWQQAGLLPNPPVGYSGQQLGSRGFAEQHGVIVQ